MYKTGKICEYCGEEINTNLRRCTFCGSLVKARKLAGSWDYPGRINKAYPEGETSVENKERLEAEIYPGNKAYQEEKVQDIVMENLRIMADDGSEEISDRRKDFSCNAEPYVVENVDRNGIIPLSNKLKVFLTVLSTIIPGFGQLLGIITAIAFMNSEDDPDRHSFGVALLVASLLMFVLVSLLCFVFILITSKVRH